MNSAPTHAGIRDSGQRFVKQQAPEIVIATCTLCQLPAPHPIVATIDQPDQMFCCHGCRHIYELIAPELAKGVSAATAMGRAGLDLNAPCCRGVIHGDPVEEAKTVLSRLMLNAFFGMMVMGISLAMYSDLLTSWDDAGQPVRSMLRLMSMFFATPTFLMLALPILEDAASTWGIYRRLSMNALIAIGTVCAFGTSVYATFVNRGHVYFETVVMTLLLVTLGRWLDLRAHVEGNRALHELLAASPTEASLLGADGSDTRVAVEKIVVGDHVRVRPGENFTVDGEVISGEGSVNQATITGEQTPAYRGPGDRVFAGTQNVDGGFVVRVTHTGEDRVMGRLIRMLDEARLHRAPIEQLADRISGYFVPAVIVAALATFGYYGLTASIEQAILNSLALVLIACPCALGVATPLAVWTAMTHAATQGVLIRSSRTLEKLAHIRQVFFDKTGTLTTGLVTVRDIQHAPGSGWQDDDLLQRAASLELLSEHPLARSIVEAAQTRKLQPLAVQHFRALPGTGVIGQVDGLDMFVGSWRLLKQKGMQIPAALAQARTGLEDDGLVVVFVGEGECVRGMIALREMLRPEAALALEALHRGGLQVEVLTGDSARVGNALGRRLNIPVQSELLPDQKLAHVVTHEKKAMSAMIGDGLNDAPALARASVGIALGCGADVTRESADVSLIGSDLNKITWLFGLARQVNRTIKWNLAWAFVYNVAGVALAALGLLHPIFAALAMVVSSALVIGNSMRVVIPARVRTQRSAAPNRLMAKGELS